MMQAADTPFEDEIRAFERADLRQAPPKGAVLFLGSSSFEKWKRLARDFAGYTVINRGFGGSIIEQSTLYAPRIVWPYEPRLIVFYAGDNDLAEGHSPEQVLADFQILATQIRHKLPATSLAFVSIKPSPARADLRAEAMRANDLIRAEIEADSSGKMRFIDVWTAMIDDSGQARRELFGPDNLHMNARGYALWTQIITPQLQAILGDPEPQKQPALAK